MTACSCSPGACHGGHTIDVGPSWVCVTEERLRQFRDDPDVCVTDTTRSMAAELLALRARVTELEAERPRFSQRQFVQAHADRDEAQSRAAELAECQSRVTDLFETWAAEENEHRLANEFGIAEGLKVAIDGLREAVHGSEVTG